ncbi:hypothetical protein BV22DRAFT_915949 [Leucogyrophana mollusca]|uniref:Uncharacterized protein n=1 Tax=Leucogyrophana mollusca TaxID=85980 RepID=A0ACB8AX89_9AGAM|nr:hypothetical protein BV22DRAFT_915949 [Leucogyrophana mollusca]
MMSVIIVDDAPPSKRVKTKVAADAQMSGDNHPVDTSKRPKSNAESSSKTKYTNDDLPAGSTLNGAWRGVLIPSYVKWYGSMYHAWGVKPAEECKILQLHWDTVYAERIPAVVEVDGPIHYVSNQRLIEWRSGLASVSLSMVTSLVASDPKFQAPEGLRELGKFWLTDKRYLFKDISAKDKSHYTGMWQSAFILQVFAAHLNYVQGAVDVPDLEDHDYTPRAALALSAAALERVFTLLTEDAITFEVITPKKMKKKNASSTRKKPNWKATIRNGEAFSAQRWARDTERLLKATKHIPADAWEIIIAGAQKFAKEALNKDNDNDESSDSDEDDDDYTDLYAFR